MTTATFLSRMGQLLGFERSPDPQIEVGMPVIVMGRRPPDKRLQAGDLQSGKVEGPWIFWERCPAQP